MERHLYEQRDVFAENSKLKTHCHLTTENTHKIKNIFNTGVRNKYKTVNAEETREKKTITLIIYDGMV